MIHCYNEKGFEQNMGEHLPPPFVNICRKKCAVHKLYHSHFPETPPILSQFKNREFTILSSRCLYLSIRGPCSGVANILQNPMRKDISIAKLSGLNGVTRIYTQT